LLSFFNGTYVQDTKELHDKYGELVRVSPRGLSLSSGNAWDDIYRQKNGIHLQKDSEWFGDSNQPTNILNCNDHDHTRIRKVVAQGFSASALKQQESLLSKHTTYFLSQLRKHCNTGEEGIVDIVHWYNLLAFDVIGDLSLGEPFHALKTGQVHPWIKSTFDAVKFWRVLRVANAYPSTLGLLLKAFFALMPGASDMRDSFFAFPSTTVEKRIANPPDGRKDFLTHMLEYNALENHMTHKEIVEHACILIMAGSEEIATHLSGLTFFLLRNPETLLKAQQEVRRSYESEEQITLLSMSRLEYLQACINEALRLYPPVTSSVPRITSPHGNVIGGHSIPGGTSICTHQYAIYRNPDNFCNPDSYVPERWLADCPERYKNDRRSAFQPFHVGPRSCIAQNLVYFEARSVMAKLLWAFDLELVAPKEKWDQQRVFVVWDKGPLMVKLKPRNMGGLE
jgi:cytochrome P450